MAYGTLAADYIIYTFNNSGTTATISSFVNGNFTSVATTGTVSGSTITGTSGVFTTVRAVTGIFTTTLSGVTVTGATGNFGTLNASVFSGATVTGVTGNFGTLNASSIPGFAVLSGAQTFSGGQRGLVNVVSFSTGIALDLSTSNNFQITLTGNTTLQNPTNVVSGQAGNITIVQGTGNNTMAFGSTWNYPGGSGSVPSLTTTSGAEDVLAYYCISPTQIAYRLVQDIKA
jgi:hypothetical protein